MHFYLCNLTPAVPRISHLFQPQLLSRRPWCVCPALLGLGLLRWSINFSRLGRRTACLRLGATSGACHVFWWLVQGHRLALPVRSGCQWWESTGVRLLTCRGDGRRWLQTWQLSGGRVVRVMLRSRCDGRRVQAAFGRGRRAVKLKVQRQRVGLGRSDSVSRARHRQTLRRNSRHGGRRGGFDLSRADSDTKQLHW